MKYFSDKSIARITKQPDQISLSGSPNFLELTGNKNPSQSYTPVNVKLQVGEISGLTPPKGNEHIYPDTVFTIKGIADKSLSHTFSGTNNAQYVNDKTFLICDDPDTVAENIRACLLRTPFFQTKFEVVIPFSVGSNSIENGRTILIRSLGAGKHYTFSIEGKAIDSRFLTMTGNPGNSSNNDMIDQGEGNVCIEAELYTDTGISFGEDDFPNNMETIGQHLVTLSKAYFGKPVWFDVNTLMNSNKTFSDSFLMSGENEQGSNRPITWTDAGTVNDFRLILKTNNGVSRRTFFYTDVLYTLTGYARPLDKTDMRKYVYAENRDNATAELAFRPLTNQPDLPHAKGQSQYFNFILKDPYRKGNLGENEYQLGIYYKLYTQSGKEIAKRQSLMTSRTQLKTVNTVKLDIDSTIEAVEKQYGKTVGTVEAYLCRNDRPVGHPLRFRIQPSCLHKVNDFAFLNSLGGWSSFNFGEEKSTSVKSDSSTFYQTLLPDFKPSSRIESISDKEVKEEYTVKTTPVDTQTAEWLREMAASIAVYELSTKRYVLIDSLDIKHNSTDNLFTLEMKYHYSDSYNGVIK